jgi:hypothetical protein
VNSRRSANRNSEGRRDGIVAGVPARGWIAGECEPAGKPGTPPDSPAQQAPNHGGQHNQRASYKHERQTHGHRVLYVDIHGYATPS